MWKILVTTFTFNGSMTHKLPRTQDDLVLKIFYLLTVACLLTEICSANDLKQSELELEKDFARTASMSMQATHYARGTIFFGNVIDLSQKHMISFEFTESYPKDRCITISKWTSRDHRIIEWISNNTDPNQAILVGNIDSDPLDEIVLFGNESMRYTGRNTITVVNWENGKFESTQSNKISANAAALIDIDLDGVNEIVFATERKEDRVVGEENINPMDLVLYSLNDEIRFVSKLELDVGIQALVVNDFTGNGFFDIATLEYSNDRSIEGRLAIYSISSNSAIKRIFSLNNFVLDSISFIDTYQYEKTKYLFIELNNMKWKALVEWKGVDDKAGNWTAVDASRAELFDIAMRRTKVYYQDDRPIERFRSDEFQTIFVQEASENVD